MSLFQVLPYLTELVVLLCTWGPQGQGHIQLREFISSYQHSLTTCYEPEQTLGKSVPQRDSKCKGPGVPEQLRVAGAEWNIQRV